MSETRNANAAGQEADGRAPAPIGVPATLGPEIPAATSEWFTRAHYYAVQAVANAERAHWRAIERRLDTPSEGWTAGEVTRTYRTNADGERRFREEAEVFGPHGYRAWLETDSAGAPRGGRLLLAAAVLASEPGPHRHRNRHVTWMRGAGVNEMVTPKPVETAIRA